jgi:lipopolysaccharide transport system ATP-binding protein
VSNSNIVINVENLGKKYIIGHQRQEPYRSLRDAIVNGVKSMKQKIVTPLGRKIGNPAYEEFWALKDVAFQIKRGEVLGIIGRNGAGKSTLLKILSRITEPTTGRITINGRVASLLEVGTGFHPELTGRENIYLNGAILGMTKLEIKSKFDEIVAFAEVEKFLDTPVKYYSSGMYVRLAFAVAAHLEPEILVVDEVLAVGDAAFQNKCLGKMENVATKEGRTVLFVSHNMATVSLLCNRSVYLSNGQVREIGTTEKVVSTYLSEVLRNQGENLNQIRVSGYGETTRFCDIKLLTNDGNSIYFGQSIKYLITIESDRDEHDLTIGSTIFSSLNNCIGTAITKQSFSIKANCQIKLHFTISNLNLAPGLYYSGFSIGRGSNPASRQDLDIVVGQPSFQILPDTEDNDTVTNWHYSWGNIVFQNTNLDLIKVDSL